MPTQTKLYKSSITELLKKVLETIFGADAISTISAFLEDLLSSALKPIITKFEQIGWPTLFWNGVSLSITGDIDDCPVSSTYGCTSLKAHHQHIGIVRRASIQK